MIRRGIIIIRGNSVITALAFEKQFLRRCSISVRIAMASCCRHLAAATTATAKTGDLGKLFEHVEMQRNTVESPYILINGRETDR